MLIIELPGITAIITQTHTGLRGKPGNHFSLLARKDRQRQPVVQWQPIIKPLRWQNSDEAQAHLSTTRFNMQVAAPSSHRWLRFAVRPYQMLARSSGGEVTGSEQSVRHSARLAHHMRGMPPLSHAESKYCHCSSPCGWHRMTSSQTSSLCKGERS